MSNMPSVRNRLMLPLEPSAAFLNNCWKYESRTEPTTTPANVPSGFDNRRLTAMTGVPFERAMMGRLMCSA